jgi:hypothetical protein
VIPKPEKYRRRLKASIAARDAGQDGRGFGQPTRRRGGSTRQEPTSSRGTNERWRTLNTFVDLVARHLSPVEIAVWMVLFRDCRDGTVKASQRNLASRSGASERSSVRAMRRLRDTWLVEVVKASKGKGEASIYRLEARPERCLGGPARSQITGATVSPVEETNR